MGDVGECALDCPCRHAATLRVAAYRAWCAELKHTRAVVAAQDR
jgi:hypothetical protein